MPNNTVRVRKIKAQACGVDLVTLELLLVDSDSRYAATPQPNLSSGVRVSFATFDFDRDDLTLAILINGRSVANPRRHAKMRPELRQYVPRDLF
jgi:hypothetical protein